MDINFELVDKQFSIPEGHKCHECKKLLIEAYKCEGECTSYCQIHLPENKKCKICLGEVNYNQKLNDKIKEFYKIKCIRCPKEMMLKSFDTHRCERECTQKCGEYFPNSEDLQRHLKEDCVNSILSCIGCRVFKDKRGLFEIHKLTCEYYIQFFGVENFFFFF
jgi:hypothetical protein